MTEPTVIETTVPIDIELIKRHFQEEGVVYLIDCENSQLPPAVLLTYLGNLSLPCQLKIGNQETLFGLLQAYLHSPVLVNLPELAELALDALLHHKGLERLFDHDLSEFQEQNQDILDQWCSRVESLSLYALYCVKDVPEYQEYVRSFPEDTTDSMVGCNFVQLIQHPCFPLLLEQVDEDRLRFYSAYFDKYIFRGKNLFEYWAVPENTLYLITAGVAEGKFDTIEYLNLVHGIEGEPGTQVEQ